MWDLLTSQEFWFATVLLFAYQVGKFNEIRVQDLGVNEKYSAIQHLTARDFAGSMSFFGTLLVFLLFTFLGFFILCSLSPSLIRGWAQINGMATGKQLEKIAETVPYPLYIAAAFMGLTQSFIPGLSSLGNVQRDFFHYWIGVPRKVIEISMKFSSDIFLACEDKREKLNSVLEKMLSGIFIKKIGNYSDLIFYQYQIKILKLDQEPDLAEVKKGSIREIKKNIEILIYAAAIATVRRGGGKALAKFSEDLGVPLPDKVAAKQAVVFGMLIFVVTLVVLWFALPMLLPVVRYMISPTLPRYWPDGLYFSGQYVVSQVIPIFVSTWILIFMWPIDKAGRYASLFFTIMVLVVIFDYLQAFYDYGNFQKAFAKGWQEFVIERFPYFVLHSMICIAMCSLFISEFRYGRQGRAVYFGITKVMLTVAVVSTFYALARVMFQFKTQDALDFVLLIVGLNVSASILCYLSVLSFDREWESTESRT